MKKQHLLLFIAIITFGLLSCGDKPEPTPEEVLVESIALNEETLSLEIGETAALAATIMPETATNKAIVWDSSDDAIAIVSDEGLVRAKAIGEVTISATSLENSSIMAECKINVTRVAPPGPDPETFRISIVVNPSSITDESFEFMLTSNDDKFACVDAMFDNNDIIKSLTDEELIASVLESRAVIGNYKEWYGQTSGSYGEIPYDSEFLMVSFAVDISDLENPVAISKLFKKVVSTLPRPELPSDVIGDIDASLTTSVGSYNLTTKPGSFSGTYFVACVYLDYWFDICDENPKNMATYMLNSIGGTASTIPDNYITFSGALNDRSFMRNPVFPILPNDQDNAIVIAPLTPEGKIDTDYNPTVLFARTKKAVEDPNLTVDIKVVEITSTTATVTVTPSNENTLFYVGGVQTDTFATYSEEELLAIMPTLGGFEQSISAGAATITYVGLQPSVGYSIIAAGIDNRYRIDTGLFREDFTSAAQAPAFYNPAFCDHTVYGSLISSDIKIYDSIK